MSLNMSQKHVIYISGVLNDNNYDNIYNTNRIYG